MKTKSQESIKLMLLQRAFLLGFNRQGNPRWSLEALDPDGHTWKLRTRPGVTASYCYRPSHHVGDVLRVSYHITATGRVIATDWEVGEFAAPFFAQQNAASSVDVPSGVSHADRQVRL